MVIDLQVPNCWRRVLKARTRALPVAMHAGGRNGLFEKDDWIFVSPWMSSERKDWISMLCDALEGKHIKFAIGEEWYRCPVDLTSKVEHSREIILVGIAETQLPPMRAVRTLAMDERTYCNRNIGGLITTADVCLFLDGQNEWMRRLGVGARIRNRPMLARNIKSVVADRHLTMKDLKLLALMSVENIWTRIYSPLSLRMFVESLTVDRDAFESLYQLSYLSWAGTSLREFEVLSRSLWRWRPTNLRRVTVILHLRGIPIDFEAQEKLPFIGAPFCLKVLLAAHMCSDAEAAAMKDHLSEVLSGCADEVQVGMLSASNAF